MNIDLAKYPLDKEVIAYLEKCEVHYPCDNGKLAHEDNRRLYLRMSAAFEAPIPDGMIVSDHKIKGRNGAIPIRAYNPSGTNSEVTIMYMHGGGFVVGNLDSHNSVCAEIAHRTGYRVVAVDYHLAPEHVHPVPLEDCIDVFLSIDQGKTILCGDSAGATLSASLCVAQLSNARQPIGQVLIYPWLGGELYDLESYTENFDAPGLTVQDIQDYRNLRSAGTPPTTDPIYYPLALEDFSKMPPCVAIAADFDPLRDDAVDYVRRLNAAGVDATCYVEEGLIHGYLRARHCSKKAGDSFTRICQGLMKLGQLGQQ
jgi:acetyl esterase